MRLKLKSNPLVRNFDRIAGITAIAIIAFFKRKKSISRASIKKILLVRFAAMGDTILMVPAIRAVRAKYPSAVIDFLASNINIGIIENCPYISRKYKFEFSKKIAKLKENIRILRILRSNKYDVIIDFEPFIRFTALFSLLLKGKFTIGFKTEKQYKHFAFDAYSLHSGKQHEVDNLLSLPQIIGCGASDRTLELWHSSVAETTINSLFSGFNITGDKVVVIHPATGGENHPRQWPAEYYKILISFLLDNYDVQIVLIGSDSEYRIAESLSGSSTGRVFNLAGLTGLNGTIEIIKRAKLFISGNTGTMHIASALNIPLIAFHGPTNAKRFGPLGKNSYVIKSRIHCSPCLNLGFEYGCDKYPCMSFITPKEVIEYIKLNNPL